MSSIKEVARVAGVSPSTVSEVLNNSTRARIGLDAQSRVRAAARELGYKPNHLARSLSSKCTRTVGLLISGFQNPFFVALAEAIEEEVSAAGYRALIEATPSHRGSYREHEKSSRWPVDGVLMWATPTQTLADVWGEGATQTPVVYLGGEARAEPNCVRFDLEIGAEQAARRVLEQGATRIAHLVPYREFGAGPFEPRGRAFRRVCGAAGVELQTLVTLKREETREAGFITGVELASIPPAKRPQAILCHNDVLAIGLCAGLARGGLRIPEDILVVGCDGIDEGRFLARSLTTIEVPVAELGKRAFEMLLQHIEDGAPQRTVVLPTLLRAGETA